MLGGVHVVGVQDDPETGCVRMYLSHRSRGIYALVEDKAAQEELRRAWGCGRHVILNPPPPADVLYTESERP